MSVATHFKHPRPFPFAIPSMDETAITALAVDFFGSGLGEAPRLTGNFAFATNLFWNVESFSTTLSGVSLSPSVSLTDYALSSVFGDVNSSVPVTSVPPRGRVKSTRLFARANHPDYLTNDAGVSIYLPVSGFIYNTTTSEYNIIFEVQAGVGESVATTNSSPGDTTLSVSVFDQTFTMQATFGAGSGSGESISVGSVGASFFSYS